MIGKTFLSKEFSGLSLYIFSLYFIIIAIVFIQSNWILNTSLSSLIKSVLEWLSFGIIGLGDINAINASTINAGVLWSLPYEWLLYFSLPLISIIILNSRPSIFYIILSVAFIAFVYSFRSFSTQHILSFIGGAIAPLVLKYNKKNINFNSLFFTIIVLISIASIIQFHSSKNIICKLLITTSFTLIALGNTLFGLLKNSTLKLLGEISYSTYLLHGVIIFIVINYIFGLEETKSLSQLEYCFFIFTVSPFVVLISFLTFRFIEDPFMKMGKKFTKRNKPQ